jgi:hypothetical protein
MPHRYVCLSFVFFLHVLGASACGDKGKETGDDSGVDADAVDTTDTSVTDPLDDAPDLDDTITPDTETEPEADMIEDWVEEELSVPTDDEWTILVYMAACAEMETGADLALQWFEEATVGGGSMVHILALADMESTEGTTVYLVEDGVTTVLEEREEENTADPAVLEEFVTMGLSDYPAERTALFIKGLGFGWRGTCLDRTGTDEFDLMFVSEMADALNAAEAASGVELGMLVLESSIMAMIEVAYELRQVPRVLLVTESKIQDDGIPYGLILGHLVENPAIELYGFARMIIRDHNQYYEEKGALNPGDETATNFAAMAAHDLTRLDAVIDAHRVFASELGACLPIIHNVVPHARDRSMVGGFGSMTSSDYTSDIVALIEQLTDLLEENEFDYGANCPGLPAAMEGFVAAYYDMLVYEQHAEKFRWVTHGLTVWYPPTENKYNVVEIDGNWIEGIRYDNTDVNLDFVFDPDAYWVDYLFEYYRANLGP